MRSKNLRHAGWLIVLGLVLGGLSPAWGQGTEAEPNNTCATAQAFGAISPPYTVTGTLENVPPNGDVDFLRFIATPNSVIIADLEGAATSRGTLGDPFLGLYNSSCQQLAIDDDSGQGLNSRLGFVVPADGVVIMAITSCCNSSFTRSTGTGTYRLTLSPGGILAGSVADSGGHALDPDFVAIFTPAGQFVTAADVTCCVGDKATFSQPVAAGTYRVVAQGAGARTWYNNQPSFAQATNIVLANNQQITNINLTLNGLVQIRPTDNGSQFQTGDTLHVDLELRNPSGSAATIIVSAVAHVPAETAIDPNVFCCFQDTLALVPATTITLPAGNNTVIHDFATHHFTGSEAPGFYDFCVTVLQGAIASQRCTFFSFDNGSGAPQGDKATIFRANTKKKP